jgi:hypothetical protein
MRREIEDSSMVVGFEFFNAYKHFFGFPWTSWAGAMGGGLSQWWG